MVKPDTDTFERMFEVYATEQGWHSREFIVMFTGYASMKLHALGFEDIGLSLLYNLFKDFEQEMKPPTTPGTTARTEGGDHEEISDGPASDGETLAGGVDRTRS